jgi:hypothetical protein
LEGKILAWAERLNTPMCELSTADMPDLCAWSAKQNWKKEVKKHTRLSKLWQVKH